MASDGGRRIWTDGACKGNPGPGGWGYVAEDGAWASGGEAQSTNQRMEIMAAYRAVLDHDRDRSDDPVTIVSDSTYVVNCFRDRWWAGWRKRGWKNSKKEPVANRDLWEPFIDLVETRADRTFFEWVKGHSGDPMNDLADRLAVAASTRLTEASGTELPDPDDAGPEDDARSASAGTSSATATAGRSGGGRDPRLPAGRLVGVFGARPPEMGGYDDNPIADRAAARLREILAAKASIEDDLHVVSGLRLGMEMLGAEAAAAEGIPFVAVLPFPDADAKWPAASRRRFAQLRDAAAAEVLLEKKVPDTAAKVGGALRRRDAWLARNLDEAIVFWDGGDRFVERLLGSLRDRLGDDVWEEVLEG